MSRPVTGNRAVAHGLIALGAAALLFAACVVQPAPTPNVEELAQALARTWATQTAEAAPNAGASAATIPASATPASTLPAALPTGTLAATDASNGDITPAPTAAPTALPTREPTSLPTSAPSATPTAASTPRPSPTSSVTPTPACAIPVDAELAAMWDRAELGCPGMRAQVIPATWQQFEHGYILWKSDQERTFVLGFGNKTDPWQGTVIANSPGWQWDGISFPNGRGLTPPPGLLEPVGRLGFVWFDKLGGPSSGLGWATAPAQELCLTMQPGAGGFVAKTNPRPCAGVKGQSLEPLFTRVQADGGWQRRPEAQPPTRTPTATPQCAIPTDPRLASAWERRELGCPKSEASVVWAAWQPFEQGSMFWRADKDRTYALYFGGGTDAARGEWVSGGDNWRWDGGFPAGRGLTPPAGRYEPVRGFGFVWFSKLGGPSSQLGWATEPEKGFCATLQPFDSGLIFASNHEVETCENGYFNRAREPDFAPVEIALKDDGSWRRR